MNTAERKKHIEALALGRRVEPWQCGCGACKHPQATVVAVTVWDFDQDKPYAWRARMRDDGSNEDYSYDCALDFVLTPEELSSVFPPQ